MNVEKTLISKNLSSAQVMKYAANASTSNAEFKTVINAKINSKNRLCEIAETITDVHTTKFHAF
jgi:hypothetical protein